MTPDLVTVRMPIRKMPHWLYKWLDRTGRMPWLVRLIWPGTHYCSEMDDLLVTPEEANDCFCGVFVRDDIFAETPRWTLFKVGRETPIWPEEPPK